MRVGLDVGSTTIKCVVLDDLDNLIYSTYERHYSHIVEKSAELLRRVAEKCGRYERNIPVQSCQTVAQALREITRNGHRHKTIIFGSLSFLHEVYRFFDTSRYI